MKNQPTTLGANQPTTYAAMRLLHTDTEFESLRAAHHSDQQKIKQLREALEGLRGACQDVLLPAINEAIKGGFKMETWTPEQMQWAKAVEQTESALASATKGGE
jgi:hypothetical protein